MKDELKSIAITEMKHAESIAERLAYLGGTPTAKPDPIFVGETLEEMLQKDKKDETAEQLFRGILADEEEHHDTFFSLLEEI